MDSGDQSSMESVMGLAGEAAEHFGAAPLLGSVVHGGLALGHGAAGLYDQAKAGLSDDPAEAAKLRGEAGDQGNEFLKNAAEAIPLLGPIAGMMMAPSGSAASPNAGTSGAGPGGNTNASNDVTD